MNPDDQIPPGEAAEALNRALASRDPGTREHSLRVAELSARIAGEMGLPAPRVEKIRLAADLHDIGKMGISEQILNKQDPLTLDETEEIRRHSAIGASTLEPFAALKDIALLVRHHHENFDGSGYPDGLAGEEIPLESRIIAVADTFDAVTSTRPYREARTEEAAIREIRQRSGSQFDPRVVEAFLRTRGSIGTETHPGKI